MNIEESFKELLSDWLTEKLKNYVRVVSYQEETRTYIGGGCETCEFTDIFIDVSIEYKSIGSLTEQEYTYKGSMGDLIQELARFEDDKVTSSCGCG